MGNRSTPSTTTPDRMEQLRLRVAELIANWTSSSTAYRSPDLPQLTLYRSDQPAGPVSGLYEPSIGVVFQGRKRVSLGGDDFSYGFGQYLVTSLNLPTVSHILQAEPARPFLSLMLTLDMHEVATLMMDVPQPRTVIRSGERAMATGTLDWPLASAFERLVSLLDEPQSIAVLAPLIQREILYRLLCGAQGSRVREMGSANSHRHRIGRAIAWMKANYARPLKIDEMAAEVRMSSSSFHHRFKALTAMSPLQYQKWLRLNEARRLMLANNLEVSTAAFQVGYESASQFSREYARQFGNPPVRDISNLRAVPLVEIH